MVDPRHPAPSPEGHDPHPAREETDAPTSPEEDHAGSPRMARELADDRKVNGYVHDGRNRTDGLAEHDTGPAQPDAIETPAMTERGPDGRVHETPATEKAAQDAQEAETPRSQPTAPHLRMPPD